MRLAAVAVLACLLPLAVGCGGDGEEEQAAGTTPCITSFDVPDECQDAPPTAIDPVTRGPGSQLIAESGCQACHRIGRNGNDGPGPDLTRVGARLSQAEIRRVLVDPVAPMPSFAALGDRKLDQIAASLAALKG